MTRYYVHNYDCPDYYIEEDGVLYTVRNKIKQKQILSERTQLWFYQNMREVTEEELVLILN